ncbi:MAG: MinD/ParA family protein [Leptospiraceae bacterium]|nr:MinD/ParA family protein [Leptospiraceae bacterium]MCP5510705.1 MinD/ParA family protein [Leptospiraceae bacterium]
MDQASGLRKLKEEYSGTKPVIGSSPPGTKIIAVSSGKGGVGKSTISINLAISIARKGKRVLVLDGDLGLANINVMLGIIPKYTLYHVIKGIKTIQEIILSTPEGIDIIPGASGYSQLADLDKVSRDTLINGFSELGNYDFILIDTGAGIHATVISLVLAADEVLIVTTPEPTSITDSYGLIKSVIAKNRNYKLNVLINKAKDDIEGRRVAKRVIEISEKFLNVVPRAVGVIYKDEEVEKSILAQKPFFLYSPRSKATHCVSLVCDTLVKEKVQEMEVERNLSSYFKKFFQLADNEKLG